MTTTGLSDQTPVTCRVPWRVDLATAGAAATCALVTWLFVAVLPGEHSAQLPLERHRQDRHPLPRRGRAAGPGDGWL